mmetsp:Transcript_34268/g.47664  ORF Transcript_34268/g.47664 Transcript_34268/m.47664 type:complete len:306 (-) Transcript_34268:388-1305(-)
MREHLPEVGGLALLVEVPLPQGLPGDVEGSGDVVDGGLRHHEPLGAPEAAEGRVGGQVGLAGEAVRSDVWDVVDVVDVEEPAVHDRYGEVLAPARVGVELHVEGGEQAVPAEADLVPPDEGVPLARGGHVHVAVEHDPDRPPQLLRGDGGGGRVVDRARLLAPEGAAHPLDLADDLVHGHAEVVGDALDGGVRVLGAGEDGHLAVLPRDGLRALCLQVKVFLAAYPHLALHSHLCRSHGLRGVPSGEEVAVLLPEPGFRLDRVFDGENGRLLLVLDGHLLSRLDSLAVRIRHQDPDELPHAMHRL